MKKLLSFILAIFMICTFIPLSFIAINAEEWDGSIATSYGGGDGTQNNPYVIATPAQLAYLASSVNADVAYLDEFFVLTSDIDLGGLEWTPIGFGIEGGIVHKFRGNFDGQGHTIKNYQITNLDSGERIGLFGIIEDATVKNLTISNVKIDITSQGKTAYIGNLASSAKNSVISNILVEDSVIINLDGGTGTANAVSFSIGGIIGRLFNSTVSYCVNKSNTGTGEIKTLADASNVGGISGCTGLGPNFIYNCINYGDFKTTAAFAAGLVGIMGATTTGITTLENCVNYGDMWSNTTTRYVSGVVASWANTNNGDFTFKNVYNAGEITGGNPEYNSGIIAQTRKAGNTLNCINVGCIQENAIQSCHKDAKNIFYNGVEYKAQTNHAAFIAAINADCANTPPATIDALESIIVDSIAVSKIAALSTNATAAVRLTEGSTGMRFTTNFNSNLLGELTSAGYTLVKASTLIVPSSYITQAKGVTKTFLDTLEKNGSDGTFTNYLEVEDAIGEGDSYFLGSIANIKSENYALNFTAYGYIVVKNNITNEQLTIYSPAVCERNVATIAQAAANDYIYVNSTNTVFVFDKTITDVDIYKVDSTIDHTPYTYKTGDKTINIDETNLGITEMVEIRSPYNISELAIINSFIS